MNILIASDSFKGSLSSQEIGETLKIAISEFLPDANVEICPIADGGEGTAEAFYHALGGERRQCLVTGPRGKTVQAEYVILPDSTAIIESAQACGLTLLSPEERDPMHTTTYGVGEMLADACMHGARHVILTLGGSATNDGGLGMLSALGYRFLDRHDTPVPFGAKGLGLLKKICAKNPLPALSSLSVTAACDVKNPLCGNEGATRVFALQKGAKIEEIEQMDAFLSHYADLSEKLTRRTCRSVPGAGAAGGLGFALMCYLGAQTAWGFDILATKINLEEKIRKADLILTGEGRLDAQSLYGKAPIGVARLAKKHRKQVIALAGCIGEGAERCLDEGIDAYYAITDKGEDLRLAMAPERTRENLKNRIKTILPRHLS